MDFPQDFTERMCRLREDYPQLEAALRVAAPVSIRLNPAKTAALPFRSHERVMWCSTGYYLSERPAFTFDPLFHAGVYYVQEAASMFLEQAVAQYVTAPAVCLDLCAAPGGKSTHLLSLLPRRSLLVSNEVIRSRVTVLAENVLKWGMPDVIVTHSDPAELGRLVHGFDVLVADLPCSGEGMFRKNPAVRREWSVASVMQCAARQRRILHDVWPALRPGGICIYSTCTFNCEENEDNIRYLVRSLPAEAVPVNVEAGWRITCSADDRCPSYRFFPHRTAGEGFFLAVLRKPDGPCRPFPFKTGNRRSALRHTPGEEWLSDADAYRFTAEASFVRAIPEIHAEWMLSVSERLRVVTAGVPTGEWKGKDFLPAPALALSTAFRRDAFPTVELAREEAIRYLQKEALRLAPDTPKGHVTVTFRKMPLGFVRHIGHRANNLYPHEWRIRSRHLPEEISSPLRQPASPSPDL
ncbi:MAG: rRNA cytosine-C5-methyltransferase [Tannerella sp.]|nr:rRNA cytosine-C5-methyltransferase [Tannerella sp.]